MDNEDIDIFQDTTKDFLNNNSLNVTNVIVVEQTLNSRRRFRRKLQGSSSLEIEMDIEGEGGSGDDFKNAVDNVFESNEDQFHKDLAGSSEFLRGELEHAAMNDGEVIPSPINNPPGEAESKSKTGLILIITGSIVGLLLILTTAFLLMRHRIMLDDDGPELDLLSWSSGSAGSETREKVFTMADAVAIEDPDALEQNEGDHTASPTIPSQVGGQLSPISENMIARADVPRKSFCCRTPKGGQRNLNHQDPSTLTDSSGTGYVDSSDSALHSLSTRTARNSRRSVRRMISESIDNTNLDTMNGENIQNVSNTPGILGDLVSMEDEWEGQLDSKVTAVAETPRQNNLEKFKRNVNNYTKGRNSGKCFEGTSNCDTAMGSYLCSPQSV